MLKSESAGGIIIHKGKFVLVSQLNSAWSLPKGRIKTNEDPLTAAKREIYEETGIKTLELVKELGSYKRLTTDKKTLRTIFMFLFKTDQERLMPKDPENPEAKWVDKEEVVKLLYHKEDKEFFIKAIESINVF